VSMTFKDLCLTIAQIEAGRKQVSIAQIREIMGIVTSMVFWEPDLMVQLYQMGERKEMRKPKKKREAA